MTARKIARNVRINERDQSCVGSAIGGAALLAANAFAAFLSCLWLFSYLLPSPFSRAEGPWAVSTHCGVGTLPCAWPSARRLAFLREVSGAAFMG